MSQQELMPEPQSSQEFSKAQSQGKQSWSGTDMGLRPSNWPRRSKTTDLPKSDHPSTFENSLPPYSYPAQGQTMSTQQSYTEQTFQWQQHDASTSWNIFTDSYPSYNQYNPPQQVPAWTQSPENTIDISKWIGILLLVVFLLVSIPVLCSLGTFFISVVFVFSFLPVLVTLAPVAFLLLIPLSRIFGSHGKYTRWQQRGRYERSWWW
jgi:hypothetical protein